MFRLKVWLTTPAQVTHFLTSYSIPGATWGSRRPSVVRSVGSGSVAEDGGRADDGRPEFFPDAVSPNKRGGFVRRVVQ
jgi:hypothetical protein